MAAQGTEVINCFDAAFISRKGVAPESDKIMNKDYGCVEMDVFNILLGTQACLSAKGYVFSFDRDFTDSCISKKVLDVMASINKNTAPKPKRKLPGK